jgi:hypothetical protein
MADRMSFCSNWRRLRGARGPTDARHRRAELEHGGHDPGERTLRVIGKRDDDADQPPALIVEEMD